MRKPLVGFIGIGHVGNPMCHNILKGGYRLTVCDIRPEAYADLQEKGAEVAATPAEVAARADIILLSLYNSALVEQVIFGDNGITSVPVNGKIVIDTSTGLPESSKAFAARFSENGGAMLDMPLTGGETGAKAGTLSFMIGGDKAVFERALPVIQTMGQDIIYCGLPGSGMVVKMANQMLITTFFTAIVEAFNFVDLHGVDLISCYKAIEHGSGQSRRLDKFGAQYLLHTLAQDANEIAHYKGVFDKDLAYVLQQAAHAGIPMPIAALSMRLREVMPNSNSVGDLFAVWREILKRETDHDST
jgi:3-hydroxyisobutyrate dehydrogenase-like beta-hydroxyacid dehydrogenase